MAMFFAEPDVSPLGKEAASELHPGGEGESLVSDSQRPSPLGTQTRHDLQSLVSNTSCCIFRPLRFFVSWNGVLTLAYR